MDLISKYPPGWGRQFFENHYIKLKDKNKIRLLAYAVSKENVTLVERYFKNISNGLDK